ncbi:MAG TPA: MgtC/SapB family protein [Candidatus Binatia bacterium]|jgi:putative Mg2+ transporter-C (MgtC) family protein|nr:MgtC/SapB family protein [Candidatus Binatia bacterium]
MITMVSNNEALVRLMLITVLSALIGMEREYHHKPAGLRTNVMVGLGSTLMTLASVKVLEISPVLQGIDPARIAAQIVTGIGFIGAGVILRPSSGRGQIIGLTTAATLWVVSGLGIAIGMGFYAEAIMTTALVFFTFVVLSKVVGRLRAYTSAHPPKYEHDEDVVDTHETREH